MRNAEQILADIAAAGGEPDDGDEQLPARSGARTRALHKLAREYPDRFRALYQVELERSGGESRHAAKARTAPLVDRIRELAAQKLTDGQIGEALDLKPAAVGHLRRANGIPAGLGRVGRPSNWRADRGRNISRERHLVPSAIRPSPAEAGGVR